MIFSVNSNNLQSFDSDTLMVYDTQRKRHSQEVDTADPPLKYQKISNPIDSTSTSISSLATSKLSSARESSHAAFSKPLLRKNLSGSLITSVDLNSTSISSLVAVEDNPELASTRKNSQVAFSKTFLKDNLRISSEKSFESHTPSILETPSLLYAETNINKKFTVSFERNKLETMREAISGEFFSKFLNKKKQLQLNAYIFVEILAPNGGRALIDANDYLFCCSVAADKQVPLTIFNRAVNRLFTVDRAAFHHLKKGKQQSTLLFTTAPCYPTTKAMNYVLANLTSTPPAEREDYIQQFISDYKDKD